MMWAKTVLVCFFIGHRKPYEQLEYYPIGSRFRTACGRCGYHKDL